MNLPEKRPSQKSFDMSGYIVIGLGFGALIGLLVGNLVLGAGIGMSYGLLITYFAEL